MGYRLFRRDFPALVERDLDDLSALGAPDDQPSAAIDGDATTAWATNSYFYDGVVEGAYLELTTAVSRQITGVQLSWLDSRKPLSFDVMAYSGRAWVRVASISEVHAEQTLRFEAPYRTSKLRIVPTASISGQSIALAEVIVSERPLIAATTFLDSNIVDGSYPYEVSAVNALGFEGPRSSPATADIGDATAPEPVQLSGLVEGRNAQLSWTASASADVAHYRLLRDGAPRADIAAPLADFVDANLANGTYTYTVVALDAFDNASTPSNAVPLAINVQGPGLPQNVQVVPVVGGGALNVAWQQGGGAPAARYTLRRALAEVGPFALVIETPALQRVDQPLINGTPYWYTVEALDAAGNASGQTAPVSGVPEDQQAPLPPLLTFPVHGGETIDLDVDNTIVAGASEAGSRVDVRRSGVGVMQANTRGNDDVMAIGGYVADRLHAAPSGSWMYGENQQVVDTSDGNYANRSFGQIVGWTRDDRVVQRDGNGLWLSSSLSVNSDRPLDLPLTSVETARFSSDLRYALALGENPVSGSPLRAIWLIDRTLNNPRRVLTIDPDSVDFATVVFAEYAGFAAWRSQAGDLVHLRLGTAQARSVAAALEPARITLSSRDGEALHVRLLAAQPNIYRVNPEGLSRSVGPGLMAAWSPDASEYVVAEAAGVLALRNASDDAVLRRINLQSPEILDLDWTISGRLLVLTTDGMRRIDPLGYFRSTTVSLQSGENRLELFATDSGGQGQASTQVGIVRRPASQLLIADLSIRSEDIRFLPAAGVPGQSYAAQITVRNIGTGGSTSTLTRLTLTGPDGTLSTIIGAGSVPSLSAGGSASLGVSLGQLNLVGSYLFSTELLVTGADANPGNHTASQRLIVSAGAAPVLELDADASTFAPGVDASGSVRVRNSGTAWSGSVRMRITSQLGEVIAELPSMPVNALAFGAEAAQVWRWPTAEVLAGGYRVAADLLDEQNRIIATRTVDFAITLVRDLRLSVTSDRAAYALADNVRLNRSEERL